MGQQVLTLAGQVIGGYFFGPVGAAVGGAIGGAIGGALFSKDQFIEGPRLGDLHIQSSTYGNAVPILKGTIRVAGNVIWASDIRETAIESDASEDKGGPSVTQIDYSYDVDAAIALCEGEVQDIERIFANGVLIYDKRTGVAPATIYASGLWATGTKLYPGSETQLPDPTIEAAVGIGNAQAYRGTAYVMFTGIQLNVLKTATLPNFEFVVVQTGTPTQYFRKVGIDNLEQYRELAFGGAPYPRVTLDEGVIRVANTNNALVYTYDLEGNPLGAVTPNDFEASRPGYLEEITGPAYRYHFWMMFDGTPAWTYNGTGQIYPLDLSVGSSVASDFIGGSPTREFCSFTQFTDNKHILGLVRDVSQINGYADQWIMFRWDGTDLLVEDSGPVPLSEGLNVDLGSPTAAYQHYQASFGESDLKTIWSVQNGGATIQVLQIGDDGILTALHDFNSFPDWMLDIVGPFANPSIYADEGLAFIVAGDGLFIYSRMPEVDSTGVLLSEVVSDICDRSGIPTTEYDVTALTQTVEGFVVAQTMTGRAAIEALRPGYFFDAVDGDKLKFVNRGGLPADTFEYIDLGAGEGDAAKIAVTAEIAQETELPSRVNIRYISKNADYQIGAQSARRETTNSQEKMDAEIPVVFEDQTAAEVADVNLRDQWAGAVVRSFNTGLKYSQYEPTDVMLLDDGFYVRQVRLTRRVDRGAMIEWESRDEDAAVYESNAMGMTLSVPDQALAVAGPTDVEILDLPPLTELPSGNEAAAYVAARGFLSGWSGAVIEVSRNSGTSFVSGTTVTTASVMGAAMTALADFLGGNVFDEASTLRVSVAGGTLASATHDDVLNGANPAVVGDEIIQFRTATLVSTGVYDLSGFLRGRKGTEWAIDGHAIGERFVMLTTNLRDLPLAIADATNNDLLVRGTSSGTFSGSSIPEGFTTQLARLMPYSPVHLSAVRNSDGSWRLTWVRRDRYMNDWNSGVDIPMSESAELYDIEIYNAAGDLVETYTDVNDTFLDVDDDVLGGSPTPASLTYSAWQKSAIVGRGFEASATITQAL